MIRWLSVFRAKDGTPDYYRQWVGNVRSLHGAIFALIESVIVLGALQYAAQQSSAWAIWVIHGIAYGMTIVLASTYLQAALLILLSRVQLQGSWRGAALWGVGLLAVLFNAWMVGALSDLVEQVIASGLSGDGEAPKP